MIFLVSLKSLNSRNAMSSERGSNEKFDRLLSKVPDGEPEEHDRLPPRNGG